MMSSYVYLIQDGDAIKIGKAIDPLKRLKTLQTGTYRPLTLLHTFRCKSDKSAFKLERSLHRRYKSKKLLGEWYSLSTADIINIISTTKSSKLPVEIPKQHLKYYLLISKKALETELAISALTAAAFKLLSLYYTSIDGWAFITDDICTKLHITPSKLSDLNEELMCKGFLLTYINHTTKTHSVILGKAHVLEWMTG